MKVRSWLSVRSLRGRLLISYLAITVLALSTVLVLALSYLERGALGQRRTALATHARVVAGVSTQYMLKGHDYLEYIARDYGIQAGARVLILDREGRALQDSFYDPEVVGSPFSGRPEVAAALKGSSTDRMVTVEGAGRTIFAAAPVLEQGRVVGAVLVAQLVEPVWAELAPVRRVLLFVSAAALALALVAGWFLANSLARPVSLVTSGVQAIANGDMTHRVPEVGADELGRLAQAFNSMSERLGRIEESRRAFVANAAHELRTPLSCLRALVEPLLSGAVTNPKEQAEFLGDIGREVDRLTDLAGDLLTLSELEAGRPLSLVTTDLHALLDRVRTRLLPMARKQEIEIRVSAPPDTTIRADLWKLERAVYNLVHNAVTFSPAGGSVHLTAEIQGGEIRISVVDQGPGIPQEDLPHIFERFYRSERSRSRERGGAGLGLAIASEILHGHGGQIRVESAAGEGTRFVAQLPSPI